MAKKRIIGSVPDWNMMIRKKGLLVIPLCYCMEVGECKFNDKLLENNGYSWWYKYVPGNAYKANCAAC